MPRARYAFRDGKCVEIYNSEKVVDAPFVHQDTFRDGLRHPKTGEMVYDHSRWNEINKQHGLRVVGNDWAGQEAKNDLSHHDIKESRIMDAIEQGYAIESCPDKSRQKRYQEQAEVERYCKMYGKSEREIREIVQAREAGRERR